MKILIAIPSAIAIASLAFFNVAFAAEAGTCAGDDPLANIFCGTNLAEMLNAAFQVSILLGAILAMLRIAYAGWLYMGAADMWSNITEAKAVFADAITGLLILLAIYMILFQINPCILKLNLDPNKTCDPKTGTIG
jgi:hypothetical protein